MQIAVQLLLIQNSSYLVLAQDILSINSEDTCLLHASGDKVPTAISNPCMTIEICHGQLQFSGQAGLATSCNIGNIE